MSRPTPEAYLKAQLDKAMRNDDTKKISSLMRKLQSLNARKATKVKEAPMPRRRRRPTSEAQKQRQAILRRRALARARARQRALLRGAPKGGNPRTRGQMSAAMKRAIEKQREAAQQRARQQRAKRDQRSARGAKLIEENRKKLRKLTGGKGLRGAMQKATRKLTKPVVKTLKKSPPPPPKPSEKRRELSLPFRRRSS